MADQHVQIVMEEVTDPAELARGRAWRERADRNAAWLQAHAAAVYPRYRGKFICVAGEELFVADSAPELLALARAAHPEDNSFFLRYIPRDKVARIMQLLGEWYECDDGTERPVIRGRTLRADGSWVQTPLLVDTGADRTV